MVCVRVRNAMWCCLCYVLGLANLSLDEGMGEIKLFLLLNILKYTSI